MATQLYLVLLETSGNQAFIFATNKLRENVGASEATYRACSQWVLEVVTRITGKTLWDEDADILRQNLLDSELNPAIEVDDKHLVEVIVAASGKAILITRQLEHAKQIIADTTLTALKEAPGLDVCGSIAKFTWGQDSLPQVSSQLHQEFEVVRSLRPGPEMRFLRLPIIEDCRTSGLPAAKIATINRQDAPYSQVSLRKQWWAVQAFDHRLPKLLNHSAFQFAKSTDKILDEQSDSNWLAVIHADGNGLGQIFIDLENHLPGDRSDDRHYINQFREFSLELDRCTREAFCQALEVFPLKERQKLPIVPLVLGGDDLTVVCDARYALPFTQKYLIAFEATTQNSPVISQIAANAFQISPGKLSACAGVAIAKSHFPFSTAYELAEELTKSAKVVKEIVKKDGQVIPCSAIDYHVLYDTSGTSLEAIRDKLTVDQGQTKLFNRPYIVSHLPDVNITGSESSLKQWLEAHHWDRLEHRITALKAKDDEKRSQLPNSQMHMLREALFLGRAGADAQYALIRKRYLTQGIEAIAAENPDSLFWQDTCTQKTVTAFLDAMDAADFWPKDTQQTHNTEESVSS